MTRNALGQTTAAWYDYGAGKVTQISDLNGVNTTYAYTDALDRPTQVRRAAGGGAGLESQTNYSYPSPNQGNSYQDLNSTGDEALRNEIDCDGLGRARANLQYGDAAGAIETDTTYDALGRVHSISNPYRPSETVYTTTTSYDALGRVTQVMTADGAATTTSYSGNQATVTDPAGKKRTQTYDGLGRLTQVVEDPDGLHYTTTYGYDALDNLVSVNQGGQTRGA